MQKKERQEEALSLTAPKASEPLRSAPMKASASVLSTPKPLEQTVGHAAPAVVTQLTLLEATLFLELGPMKRSAMPVEKATEGSSLCQHPFSADLTSIRKEPEGVEPRR